VTKSREFNSCTILRTFNREHYTVNLYSGVKTFIKKETVTEPCNVPLFADLHRKRGVCKDCSEGWEVEGNIFASHEERSRASK
jgi:hypothetical protein